MVGSDSPVERFSQFPRDHCTDAVSSLAVDEPGGKHSVAVNWQELAAFDTELAEQLSSQRETPAVHGGRESPKPGSTIHTVLPDRIPNGTRVIEIGCLIFGKAK
jgi:hypothetical protein